MTGIARKTAACLSLVGLACLAAPVANGHPAGAASPALEYDLPAPGTYRLQRIMPAPDGEVLDVDGHVQRLSHFIQGRITLLGFIYTTCTDPVGCPLAYRVFDRLAKEIRSAPSLRGKVQFVTLSFDPARDTPSVMAGYAGSRLKESAGLHWYFLTTRSARELMPLVEGFGQDVRYTIDARSGKPVRELSHVLKVFLIDGSGDVREIYTSTFLHPPAVINDIRTLLLDKGEKPRLKASVP